MTTVTEWFWDFDVAIQLVAFVGTGEGANEAITLQVYIYAHPPYFCYVWYGTGAISTPRGDDQH